MSSSNCCFLTYIHIFQKAGQVIWYSHLLKNFPQLVVNHMVKGFGVVNKAGDVLLGLLFFRWSSGCWLFDLHSSAFSRLRLNTWKLSVHVLLKPNSENLEHYFASVWDECNCAIVWTFFGIALLWTGIKSDLFLSSGHWVFQIFWHIACSTLTASSLRFKITQLEFNHLH